MTPQFLFVHGWAMDPSLWDAVRDELGGHAGTVRGLRYFAPPPDAPPPDAPTSDLSLADAPVIGVGHSLGVMQLLDEPPAGLVGLVAINGFTRFAAAADHPAGMPVRLLHRMMHRLDQDADATAAAFRARCGLPAMPCGRALPALRRGLEMLVRGDRRQAWRDLAIPVLALAARQDGIVPPALSVACFGTPLWAPAGGHLLPLSHAPLCARTLRDFAGRLG